MKKKVVIGLIAVVAIVAIATFVGCIENHTTATPTSITPTPTSAVSTNILQCNWTGTWDTTFGEMKLFQKGNLVVGTYEYRDGKIVGEISGYTLAGTWFEGPSYSPSSHAGDFEFIISSDCNSFSGQWRFGSTGDLSSWTGKRITSIDIDSDGDGVPDKYDYAPHDPYVQTESDVKTTGFEVIFAITGLLAVAYLVRRRK